MNRYHFDAAEHVHTLDGKPLTGVSRVSGVIAKPLTWWAAGKALELLGWSPQRDKTKRTVPAADRLPIAAAKLDEIKQLSPEEYLALLDRGYRAHDSEKNKAATKGTNRHADAEAWIKSILAGQEIKPAESILSLVRWSRENVKRWLWSEIHCYSEKHWLGGIIDAGAELYDHGIALIDFKSSKEAYAEQFWQAAGYDILLSENGGYTPEGEKIFDLEGQKIARHIIFPFGAEEPTGETYLDLDGSKQAFLSALTILRELQRFEEAKVAMQNAA
jgi:hypothetical protein